MIHIKDIKINGKQNFMGKDIPVILGGFGHDKKCMSDKTIAEIHNQPEREIRRRITDNIRRFTESIDLIDLNQRVGESHTLELLLNLGYAKQSITQAEHIYILSERGYSKLIKIMDTDLAWEIHDKLMDEYFIMKEIVTTLSEKDLALIAIVNAKTDIETAMAIKHYEDVIASPLIETIEKQTPLVELAELRIDKKGCFSITNVTKSLNLKRGQITKWAKEKGYIHKKLQEVNNSGNNWFKVYSTDGVHNQIGITDNGLLFIKDNIENVL